MPKAILVPFHLAFNVTDLDVARQFYGEILGASEGRSTETWVDFDFYGHQLSLHLGAPMAHAPTGLVGDNRVPMPHFGVVLPLEEWRAMGDRLRAAGVKFALEPQGRFIGEAGEQWTMFFFDPSGNPMEIKGLANYEGLFET